MAAGWRGNSCQHRACGEFGGQIPCFDAVTSKMARNHRASCSVEDRPDDHRDLVATAGIRRPPALAGSALSPVSVCATEAFTCIRCAADLLPPLSRTTLQPPRPNGPAEAREAHMDFIFMLTRNDKTVSDCLHVIDLIEPLGLRHIGLKDVGVTEASAGELVNRIKARGATSCMEVVSITPQAADLVDPDGRQDRRRSGPGRSGDRDGDAGPARNRYRILSIRRAPCRPSDESRRLTRDCRGLSSRSRYRLFGCRSARLPAFSGTDPGARGAGADAFTIGSSAPALIFLAQDVRQHRLALRVEAVRAMPRNSAG